MDFFEHQERARHRTTLLLAYFAAAVVLIIFAVYLAVAALLFSGNVRNAHGHSNTMWFPDVFAAVSLGTVALVSLGSLFKIAQLSGGGEAVASALGGRRIPPDTRDLDERVLLNVVEEMAIASGMPVPPVFLLDSEQAINAFAAGTCPQNAVIGITRGAIDTLSRDELQGVIAHEFSHILNGDMRLNIRLIGLLNGILLIATIGYFLTRTGSSSSNSDNKGGNALPLLGICLYLIGYVGVFFGHLIKSTVSRQREFLADASAVQFTRLPDGIAGALKKIGGITTGSRLKTAHAEEASHLFFGNGLAAPFMQLLATHPPLAERIRRIDPSFSGRFPAVEKVSRSDDDVIDPRTLAMRRAASEGVHLEAVAGAQQFAMAPEAAVAQVGIPRNEHLDYAGELVGAMPSGLAAELREPLGAVAAIYALLLADEGSEIRQTQLADLAAHATPPAYQETLRIAPLVQAVKDEEKLPLVSMVLPALKGLSTLQLAAFRDDVTRLIEADRKVTLFEYAVRRLILKRLLPRLEQVPPRAVRYSQLAPLARTCGGLLSTLARSGAREEEQATRAFDLGIEKLSLGNNTLRLSPREECGLKVVDAALDQLAFAAPKVKKQVLEACAATIGADGRVTVEEAELLRVISDAFDCPMPPLVSGMMGRVG
jgi:Zn-dependent protease with chaperone function